MSSKNKATLSLVGVNQAKVGYRFVFVGIPQECKSCGLFRVCLGNLELGRVYEVVGVRSMAHDCALHEVGARVVEVRESEVEAALESRVAVEGGIVTFAPIRCVNEGCPYARLCNPVGLRYGDRCKVVKVSEKIRCATCGLSLTRATLLRV